MKATDMNSAWVDDITEAREHAAQVFADARRRQLALALEGKPAESAAYAQVAATARGLLDEFEAKAIEDRQDEIDLVARREAALRA